jgi:ribose transport system ATP-binding protein
VLNEKVRMIKGQGVAVIFISHKLDEVMLLSDRISVMRDGRRVFTRRKDEVTKDEIIDAIVGRSEGGKHGAESIRYDTRRYRENPRTLLKMENVCMDRKLRDISFELREGELLGLVGVSGSGISEVGKILMGLEHEYRGGVYLDGKAFKPSKPQDAVRKGIGYVPKDRKEEGIIPGMSVGDNITLSALEGLSRGGFMDQKRKRELVDEAMETVDMIPKDPEITIGSLSGGNQQKGVIARWISKKSRILILDEPTRGVDVGAIHKIYSLIRGMADKGLGVIIISSEFEEVCNVVDKIHVFNKGMIVGEIGAKDLAWENAFALAVK